MTALELTHIDGDPGDSAGGPRELTYSSVLKLIRQCQHLLRAVCIFLLLGQLLQDLAAGQGCSNTVLALGHRGTVRTWGITRFTHPVSSKL